MGQRRPTGGRTRNSANVCFGSQAVIRANTSLMSASGRKAVTQKQFFRSPWLKVCFHPKRSFRLPNFDEFEGQLSAKSGHSGHLVKETLDTHLASRYCGKNKPTTLADHEQTGNAAQQVASWYYLFSQHKHG